MKYVFFFKFALIAMCLLSVMKTCGNTDKGTEDSTETIMVVDSLLVNKISPVNKKMSYKTVADEFIDEEALTLILVRHAEKQGGKNPDLTEAGQERASDLGNLLSQLKLDAVYSTKYNRTQQTAAPTAQQQNLDIVTYNTVSQLKEDLMASYSKGTILVVGHSNTTPSLLNLLIDADVYDDISLDDFDNLYLVNIYPQKSPRVLHLDYGVVSP